MKCTCPTLFSLLLFTLFLFCSCEKNDPDQPPVQQQEEAPVVKTISPTSGGFQTVVTITGTGFSTKPEENNIFFNGVPASVLTATNDTLTVSVPKDAGAGRVSLKWKDSIVFGPLFDYFDPYVITIAGTGTQGYKDGPGATAEFDYPYKLTLDDMGNLYVASATPVIRKIDTNGIVSTIAGSTASGYADGPAMAAKLHLVRAITIDLSGNLFFIDNGCVRKLGTDGMVTTFAGSGPGTDGNPANGDTTFLAPEDIAIDSKNNLYVADATKYQILKITPGGVVTSLAGGSNYGYRDGQGANALFFEPEGLDIDKNDNIFVADKNNNRIRKITPGGMVSWVAGSGHNGDWNGPADNADFARPLDVAVEANGDIYVCDESNHNVRKISNGIVSSLAGNDDQPGFKDGSLDQARFNYIRGVAVDKKGNVYVADLNHTIRKIVLHR